MRYTLRAYKTRQAGESGKVTPADTCNTGNKTHAEHYARGMAEDYGACVIVDNETGARLWFERKPD